jgi:ankyrin repeat protein
VALKRAQVTSVAMRLCRMQGLLVDTADEVLDESSGETMLMRQAALGNAAAARLLVDAGARRDAADGEGETALMYAAAAGQRETALALVSAWW